MNSGKVIPTTQGMATARTIALMIFGNNAPKQLALELGCSCRQAQRIVTHGYVPQRFLGNFWHVVEQRAESLLVRVEAARDRARAEQMRLRDMRLAAAPLSARLETDEAARPPDN